MFVMLTLTCSPPVAVEQAKPPSDRPISAVTSGGQIINDVANTGHATKQKREPAARKHKITTQKVQNVIEGGKLVNDALNTAVQANQRREPEPAPKIPLKKHKITTEKVQTAIEGGRVINDLANTVIQAEQNRRELEYDMDLLD